MRGQMFWIGGDGTLHFRSASIEWDTSIASVGYRSCLCRIG
jgi:hypothetical protein